MQTLGTIAEKTIAQAKANAQNPQSSKGLDLAGNSRPPALKDDADGQKAFAVMLSQCFDTLKLYGKEPDQLKSAAAIFRMVLAEFTIEQIRGAFAYHLQISSEMPAPADIANIIRRGNKPPLERAVYVSISKKYAGDRTREEWAYMREYEAFQIHG